MKQPRWSLLMVLPLLMSLLACNLEKEVVIELPDYERELVVECFMEPGKPFRLYVNESIGFAEGADTPFVFGAKVIISHGSVHDTLSEGLFLEPIGFKIYNFMSSQIVPVDYNTSYEIEVLHPDGRRVTGRANVMPKVDMGSLNLSYDADTMASLTMNWQDIPNQADYYRLTLHKGTLYTNDPDAKNPLRFDFTLDDRIGDGQTFTVGTFFDFKSGDTLITTLYHISEEYWKYINSLNDAASSNGNPFAQPGIIRSTVSGGQGVFTGYHLDRDTIIVP